MVPCRRAGDVYEALVTVMRHRGTRPDEGAPVKAPDNLFDLHCLWRSAEAEDPLAGDLLAFLGGAPVDVFHFMNAGRNDAANQPLEGSRAGSVERASRARSSVLFEADVLAPAVLLREI